MTFVLFLAKLPCCGNLSLRLHVMPLLIGQVFVGLPQHALPVLPPLIGDVLAVRKVLRVV